MPGLKDVKNKIKGIGKTAQITKTMYMVASAKLRSAQKRMEDFRPYTAKFTDVMQELSGGGESETGVLPLMEQREVKTVALVVITSDRGLAGSFNSNILRAADRLRRQYEGEGKKVSVVAVGKKASRYFRKTGLLREEFNDIMGSFLMFNARDIAQVLTRAFLAGECDRVDLIYGKYFSMAVQKPEIEQMLPIEPVQGRPAGDDRVQPPAAGPNGVYTFEPDAGAIMNDLPPLFLNVQVYHAMLEVGASEQAARMTAMDNATKACKDMIKDLTRLYNKARQAAVTNELIDIVGGAEALKG